ncbi:D-Ala-D-Ala carboxypeptidase family metallohydrolase [Desulfofustis glycolicus]|uniref:Peptidase M15 n=1 Tax=Desulfofustis glycolicus DSM 9705 TaxID=1121409 RepID=A0A1M5S3G4_9BACT|nr:D-Ala-D-Ala carboxypeptidase family metallohydrolase [Desulfofustis glycolicus]SHH32996.1 Peptidase M15 [Desulfofustis glycolicus DSM 9705]
MTRLSTHFNRQEFTCRCGCGFDTVDAELLTVLQWLRWETGKPVRISSGCRCEKYNIRVKGAKRSKHLTGRAADIVVDEYQPAEIFHLIDTNFPDRLGLIEYGAFVHIDTREGKYRDKR